MARESFEELIFQLGDAARERFGARRDGPRALERVLRAEKALVARQAELEQLEAQMNDEDAAHQDYLAALDEERAVLQERVKKHKRVVDGVEGKTRELRKKLSSARTALRYERISFQKDEEKHKELEATHAHDVKRISTSRDNLKRLRVVLLRKQREVEDFEAQMDHLLTPDPATPGAEGIQAHRRLIAMDDEVVARKEEFERAMEDLDHAVATKEEEVAAAEDYLDQALYLLGEECYAQRLADPALAPFYPRLDKAK